MQAEQITITFNVDSEYISQFCRTYNAKYSNIQFWREIEWQPKKPKTQIEKINWKKEGF